MTGLASNQRGSASRTELDHESRDVSIGSHLGTISLKVALIFLGSQTGRDNVLKTMALLNELFYLIGTPSYALVFTQFLRELELARSWINGPQEGHPHDLLHTFPLRCDPSYRSCCFGAIVGNISPTFRPHMDAFRALIASIENSCTEPRDEQAQRYLDEVTVLLDMLYQFVP